MYVHRVVKPGRREDERYLRSGIDGRIVLDRMPNGMCMATRVFNDDPDVFLIHSRDGVTYNWDDDRSPFSSWHHEKDCPFAEGSDV